MNASKIHEFNVPIDDNAEGAVVLLWPCNAGMLNEYVMKRFDLDPGDRNTWEGKCYFSQELDDKVGRPFVVIALKNWDLSLNDPPHRESLSAKMALLAHECFHAAEWLLKQSGSPVPAMKPDGKWEAWEDAAYLLQRLMRRALEGMLKDCLPVIMPDQDFNQPPANCQLLRDNQSTTNTL